jgi:hypothetical protein
MAASELPRVAAEKLRQHSNADSVAESPWVLGALLLTRVEQVSNHTDTAVLDFSRTRVLLVIDKVL